MANRETSTVKTLVAYLESKGAYVEKSHGSGMNVGKPDLRACLVGLYIAIEVKAEGAARGVTSRQSVELARIRRAGGCAFEARTTADIDRELAAFARRLDA